MKKIALLAIGVLVIATGASANNSISVETYAAMSGTTYGLEAVADGTATNAYVQDDSPADETVYRAQFMFDPNSMTMDVGGRHIIFSSTANSTNGNKAAITLQMKYGAGGYAVRAMSQVTAGDQREKTADVLLSDGPHEIMLEWQVASGPGLADGMIRLTVDGSTVAQRLDVRSYTQAVKNTRMGHVASSIDATTVGSHYFDEFSSFRTLAP